MRKLNLKKHFALNEDKRLPEISGFAQTTLRNNSIFNPKVPGSQCLEAFKKMVEDDLKKLERMGSKNMKIWKTIKEIGKKKEVPADKGGDLVILNKKDYEEELENLLRVWNTYNKLKGNLKQ